MVARHALAVYDAMIVTAALVAGCKMLLSEDMQHGQVFQRSLKIVDPFR